MGTVIVAAACRAGAAPGASTAGQAPAGTPAVTVRSDPGRLEVSTAGWATDFTKATIDLSEVQSGGPPKDGIPAVDEPVAESIGAARSWLADVSPVLAVEVERTARAYPLAILVWHEIANDTLGGRPIVVTFCPLCNTGLVFDRTLDGAVHDFGTTGNLRFSDLVMYDRQTESWWQQATGQAIVGELAGRQLTFLPSQIISMKDFATAYPNGDVLSRNTGHNRAYGVNPYVGYDDVKTPPFLFDGVVDSRLAAKERVVTVSRGAESVAFPYTELAKAGAANVVVGGDPIVVIWAPGTASPLDSRDINGRDIGATGVFSPVLDGRRLTFERDGGPGSPIRDRGTGSSWSISGQATEGPLAGRELDPIVQGDHFWFAWAAFRPDTWIWTAP
jgi:hypothetical protein